MPKPFRKTLLAIAVAGIPVYSQAQSIALDNKPLIFAESYSEAVQVTGNYTGTIVLNEESTESAPISASESTFAQSLGINTQLEVNGKGVGGIELWDTEVGSDLTIEGTIQVVGDKITQWYSDNDDVSFEFKEGYEEDTWGPFGVVIEGEHDWYVDDQGGVFTGKYTSSVGGNREGNLTNKADITVTGEMASGFIVSEIDIGDGLVNEGVIRVAGKDSVAFSLEDANLRQILNFKQIIASGENSIGLHLSDKIQLDSTDSFHVLNGQGARIEGEHAALLIEGGDVRTDNVGKPLIIRNAGTLVSKRAAIEAGAEDDGIDLDWVGGTITGDLLGLSNVTVRAYDAPEERTEADGNGNATFNRLDAGEATIKLRSGGKLSIAEGAHLELGQYRTVVEGDLSVAAGSSVGLALFKTTHQQEPILKVRGDAEFGEGSQVKLTAKGSDFSADNTEYTLVEANTIVDNGLTVTSTSALLKVESSNIVSDPDPLVTDRMLKAKVTQKSTTEISNELVNSGVATGQAAQNAGQAAKVFTPLLTDLLAKAPADPIAAILGDQSGSEESKKAQQKLLTQLAPEVSGGASQAAVSGQSIVSNVASGRTGGARGLSSGGAFAQTGVWVQALNSDATQDLRDGVAGFDASTTGIAVGLDGKLNEQLTLGLAYSFLDTDVDAEGGNKTEVQGHNFTLYSGFVQNGFFVDGSLTYGQNANEGKRLIATTLAKADYDSNLLGVNLTAGYTYPLQGTVVVEPQVTARYSNVEIDAIQESGSSAALNTDAQRYEVGELGAGVQLVGRIDLEQGSISPRIKLMAYHDLIADQAQSTSSFVLGGTPFVTTGAKPERNSYEAGLGADYRLGALTLGVSYDYFGKSDYSSDTFSAKVRYDF